MLGGIILHPKQDVSVFESCLRIRADGENDSKMLSGGRKYF